MASFAADIWESIFTPGPTPPLLVATNVTFAALQLTLGLLLLATHSVHCVVLSVICGGLWWSINWFAAELKLHQAREAEAERRRKDEDEERKRKKQQQKIVDSGDDSDTETEGVVAPKKVAGAAAVVGGADVEVLEPIGEVKRTGAGAASGTASGVSTEDEWEKVSESEQEKDK
ncbi:hypothetical protein N3K66_002403 [Trichothecium roseum]|uniref:Uncharacterized protein n=1 Tax=Trichothecium roseum TaxID=47278 RepID=A0ACC0VAY2_9HYPO|nr:hypothetical protein N3K66_002403 [Trichothecium roseum]